MSTRNKGKIMSKGVEYNKRYNRKYPWVYHLHCILCRVNYKTHNYYKRGIKNFLTLHQIKELWFRDKAYLLLKPSINRINPKENYTFKNCNFIEMKENRQHKKVNQYSLGGKLLRTFHSLSEAGRFVGLPPVCIWYACNYHYRTARGYKWTYHEEKLAPQQSQEKLSKS